MLSITLQVNLHIAVHACKHCISDAFQSHNRNKGHMFEDDENISTIVAQSKQSVNVMDNSVAPAVIAAQAKKSYGINIPKIV